MKDSSGLPPFVMNYDGVDYAGVDEVGRGPLAGDVVAAAVILDPEQPIEGLRDSKKLTHTRREQLALLIKDRALGWSVARASVAEIDQINILQASLACPSRYQPAWCAIQTMTGLGPSSPPARRGPQSGLRRD